MKRYTPFVPSFSGRATFEEDEKGEWGKWEDIKKGIELLKTTAKTLNDIEDLRGAVLYQLIVKYLQEIGEGK